MKHKFGFIYSITFSLILFSSCLSNTGAGIKKDLNTGLVANYKGLVIDDIYLADADGNRLSSTSIALGSKINITATGVSNFTESAGIVYPGCTIILTDKSGNQILNLPDAFAGLTDGTTAGEAKILQASLNTGDPMLVGETYKLHIQFFDKKNKANTIIADVDLLMK